MQKPTQQHKLAPELEIAKFKLWKNAQSATNNNFGGAKDYAKTLKANPALKQLFYQSKNGTKSQH